ncbi:MAG: lipopolysaccharide assembly protein LapA domain-containing protein [Stellaceae bacterium]
MRFIYWFITALIALVVVVFAVSNRAVVALTFFPLPAELQAPLYLVVIAAVILGFIFGACVAWLGAGKHRREARHLRRRIDRLQRDVAKTLPAVTEQ